MTAATPPDSSSPAVLSRWRDPKGRYSTKDEPRHIHTIRYPDPLWAASVTCARVEGRKEGVSEIVRELSTAYLRPKLRAAGIAIDDDEDITAEHAAAYARACSAS